MDSDSPDTEATIRQQEAELLAGPPDAMRKELWLETTGAGQQLRANPGYFARLLEARMPLRTIFTKQIERDLNRTFPSESFFESQETQEALRRILVAYSWRNPNVGYCQGMNCFVGRLFSFGFSEEETFWLLAQVVERYLPIDYFSVMTGVLVDNKVFETLLRMKQPKVYKYLRSKEIDTSYFCVQWFVCMYASHFSKPVLARIWDVFFVRGANFLFELGLILLWLYRLEIAKIKEFHEVVKFIETHSRSITDPNVVISLTHMKKFQLSKKRIFSMQDRTRTAIKEDLMTTWAKHAAVNTSEGECVNDEDCKQKSLRTSSFFIFSSESLLLREDYLCDENLPRHFNVESLRENHGPLMLGRKSHQCALERQHFIGIGRNSEQEETRLGGRFFDESNIEL